MVELLAVMAIMGILAGVVSGAVVGLGSKGQITRLQGDRNTIAKSADRFFTDAFPQTYPVVDIDTNGDGEVDELDDLVSVAGDLNVRLIDFDAIIPQNATLSFVPDFLKEVPDSAALVSWRVDQATGNVFFTEDGAALVRPSLARFDVKAKDTSRSKEGASVQSDHVFTLTMRQGEAPINTIEMTIPAGYVIGGQQLTEGAVVGSLAITFKANNPWDTGNELNVETVPVVVVSGNRWKAVVNYDLNSGGTTDDKDVKNVGTALEPDIRIHTIRISPPSGANSPGSLTLKLDRVTEGGGPAPDFGDYEDPDVNEATEIFTLTLFGHPRETLDGPEDPLVNLITNPESKGVFRWLAQQNSAIDLEDFFDGLAGNQAVVIKTATASASSEGGSEGGSGGSGPLVQVFSDDFTGGAMSDWSGSPPVTTALIGTNQYLGEFANETATLSLTGLASHTEVTVTFDLYIIGTWDGNDLAEEDFFEVIADTTDTIFLTTFSTSSTLGAQQAFPDAFPLSNDARDSEILGDSSEFTTPNSIYNLTLTFNHTGSTLDLDFQALGLDTINDDEVWGLDDVTVKILTTP